MDVVARHTGVASEEVRRANFYRDDDGHNVTPYGQVVEHNHLEVIWDGLLEISDYSFRRAEIAAWNEANPHVKRGLAITPVKAFTI